MAQDIVLCALDSSDEFCKKRKSGRLVNGSSWNIYFQNPRAILTDFGQPDFKTLARQVLARTSFTLLTFDQTILKGIYLNTNPPDSSEIKDLGLSIIYR